MSSCVPLYFFSFLLSYMLFFFFFQAEDGIRDVAVTRVQTCALPILVPPTPTFAQSRHPQRHQPRSRRGPAPTSRTGNAARTVIGSIPHSCTLRRRQIGRASCRERV